MKKSRVANVVMASLLLITTNGCSLFAPKSEDIFVDSEPQGAQVIAGNRHGTTPCTISVPCNKDVTVIVKKNGYGTQTYKIGYSLGTCGILDIVGTVLFLVPAVGFFSAGAYTLDQHTVYAPLTKKAANE